MLSQTPLDTVGPKASTLNPIQGPVAKSDSAHDG